MRNNKTQKQNNVNEGFRSFVLALMVNERKKEQFKEEQKIKLASYLFEKRKKW